MVMTAVVAISAVSALALVLLHCVCRTRRIAPPPLRFPLAAAIGIPILQHLPVAMSVLPAWRAAAIQLLLGVSVIRLVIWLLLQLPGDLGWWRPVTKILRDLLALAVATALTLVVVHQQFQVNLVGLAATSAVLTAVVGLAAQETLKNLFAGVSLQVDSPFREGDWVDLGFTRGVVTSLRLMTTRIRTLEGALVVVPNGRIATDGLHRYQPGEPVGQTIDVGLDYSLPPRQAIELLRAVVQHHRSILSTPQPKIWVEGFDDSAVNYQLRVWQSSALQMRQVRSDLLEQIWYSLHRIGQSIPFPIRDIRTNGSPVHLPSRAIDQRTIQTRLEALPLFASLDRSVAATLAEQARCESFAPGELVIAQGAVGQALYVLLEGEVQVERHAGHGGLRVLATLTRNDLFGEISLCTGAAHSASVRCLAESVILVIEKSTLIPVMDQEPRVLERLGSLIAQRRDAASEASEQHEQKRRLSLMRLMRRIFDASGPADSSRSGGGRRR